MLHPRAKWRVPSVLRSKTLPLGEFTSPEEVQSPTGSPRRPRRGGELRWMPEFTTFSTLENHYNEE